MMRKRIAIVTATRAEYGLLLPLIRQIYEDAELTLDLIVTGAHLVETQGMTIREIQMDSFPIAHELPIVESGDTPYHVSATIANALRQFAECLRNDRPDMLVILGDRTEMLGVAVAAMNERIPVAHICGGEVTEGAVDDCIRHALTKMSYLHFTETEEYRRRVIQLGEAPKRVFDVGSLGAENVRTAPLLEDTELRREIGIPREMPYVVVTLHPVTLDGEQDTIHQTEALCDAMASEGDFFYLITRANTDVGGEALNHRMECFASMSGNATMVDSLGMIRYLSAVKYATFVLGNSSSGITEAPILGTPTVNIGDRQKGRLMAETIINCLPRKDDIIDAMHRAQQMERRPTDLYGDGHTSERILEIIKEFLFKREINIKKGFYDL